MKLVGLADCNTFYASCEKIFRPDLKKRPVVVLSNNDGCIVALSKEAKDIGIVRGTPFFKVENELKEKGVAVFSSNYTLYQDISDRVVSLLKSFTDSIEIYSIDEAFFHLDNIENEKAEDFIERLAFYLKKGIGIPVSIGLARTKTLAKIANHIAKKQNNSFFLYPEDEKSILADTPISDVWGLGHSAVSKLTRIGIKNALEFTKLDDSFIIKNFTATGYNTAYELRGVQMIREEKPEHMSVTSSISFASPVRNYDDLEVAVACHCSCVCSKLIARRCNAKSVGIQILTSRFRDDYENISGFTTMKRPTCYLPAIISEAVGILKKIYKVADYKSVRVIVWDLYPINERQYTLFDSEETKLLAEKQNALMQSIFCNRAVSCASAGFKSKMQLAKFNFLSPHYTTRFSNLPIAGRSDRRIS